MAQGQPHLTEIPESIPSGRGPSRRSSSPAEKTGGSVCSFKCIDTKTRLHRSWRIGQTWLVYQRTSIKDLLCKHAKSLHSCPTLCDPMDCSPSGFSVFGILQATITGVGCPAFCQGIFPTQVFFTTSTTWEAHKAPVKVKVKSLSRVWLFVTPWILAYQASPSMGFSKQGYWSGLLLLSPGDPPNPGIEPEFPALKADALPSEPPGKHSNWPWKQRELSISW